MSRYRLFRKDLAVIGFVPVMLAISVCFNLRMVEKKNSSKPIPFTRVLSYWANEKRVREGPGNEVGRNNCR